MADPKRPSRDPDEEAFLAAYDASEFPHPSVAVDVAIVTVDSGRLKALLVQRDEHPFRNHWALPGGFVGMRESLDAAAARVLHTKGGLKDVYLEQLYTFGAPARDPRTRVLSVAYYALVPAARFPETADDRVGAATLRVTWKGEAGGPVAAVDDSGEPLLLAFDHSDILGMVVRRLRGKLDYAALGFELLPRRFTLRALQEVHETILGRRLNKDSFRRRMIQSGRIRATGRQEANVGHRPAELYRFVRGKA